MKEKVGEQGIEDLEGLREKIRQEIRSNWGKVDERATVDQIESYLSRIFEFPAKKLGIPVEKFYVNVDRRGNCSSTSVLLALREAIEEGRIKKGDLVMLLSFGGGLTWGSMLVEW